MYLYIVKILLVGSILLFISIIAGKTSHKSGIPVLILFLVIGMFAGPEGIGGISFNDPKTALFIGIFALNIILFSGGIDTDWNEIRPVLWKGIILSTLGVVITATAVGIFIWAVTDFTIYEGLLVGSIVSSTDSAAVFSILRTKNLTLKNKLGPILELEGGSNDPMSFVLTIALTEMVVNQETALLSIIPLFLKEFSIGGIIGFISGKIGKVIIDKIKLEFEGLYIVLVIAIMFFSFSSAAFSGGNGFLSVYICALYLGKHEFIHKKKILKSFDGFAWLMQVVLFLTLGLLVFPGSLIKVAGIGLLISIFLILVARPLSVFISLHFFKVDTVSKLFISWVGLRGAVPIVFATFPLLAGAENSVMFFNIVFFITITSVLIQGTTITKVAKLLHLTEVDEAKILEEKLANMTEFIIPAEFTGKLVEDFNLPGSIIIAAIYRKNVYFIPEESTLIEPDDKLFILNENPETLPEIFSTKKSS